MSKLIESYLTTLTKRDKGSVEITPLVKSLSGVISLDKDFDAKEVYAEYLIEK